MARICVTGGAGFVGSALVERLLLEGHFVDVIDNLSSGSLSNLSEARNVGERNLTFQRIDICSGTFRTYMRLKKPAIVFHLASNTNQEISNTKPAKDAEINVLGSINVFSACIENNVEKIIYACSGAQIYGTFSEPISEGAVRRPVSTYGVSKNSAYEYLYSLCRNSNTSFTALALGDVYGPKQRTDEIIPTFISHMLKRERSEIYGDGTAIKDFVFIDDVVEAFSKAQSKGSGLLINIGTGVETSIQSVYEKIAGLASYREPPKYVAIREHDLKYSVLDSSRAAIHLDWKSWTELDEGVARTMSWHKAMSYR